jgi:hypothetical protein
MKSKAEIAQVVSLHEVLNLRAWSINGDFFRKGNSSGDVDHFEIPKIKMRFFYLKKCKNGSFKTN